MPEVEVRDILCMAIPVPVEDGDPRALLTVTTTAVASVLKQYAHIPDAERPTIIFRRIDTMLTKSVKEVDDWPMIHDCDNCREGINKTREHLLQNPEASAGLANIYYVEKT